MLKITQIANHYDGTGMIRIDITYSNINEDGSISSSNQHINRLVVDETLSSHIDAMFDAAQIIIDDSTTI